MNGVWLVYIDGSVIDAFSDEIILKRSIDFSCHKLEGKVEYESVSSTNFIANTPDGQVLNCKFIPVRNEVQHI